jgi:hypothetical protein
MSRNLSKISPNSGAEQDEQAKQTKAVRDNCFLHWVKDRLLPISTVSSRASIS